MILNILSTLLIGTTMQSATIVEPFRGVIGEIVTTPVAYAEEIPAPVLPDFKRMAVEDVQALIKRNAEKYGVNYNAMWQTVKCEAPKNKDGTYDATGQSQHVANGKREDSWGLSQIHLPSHKAVSKEQAQDPEFAVAFMAENFANGRANMWTCYRILKASGNLG